MRSQPLVPASLGLIIALALLTVAPAASLHPRLLFDAAGLEALRAGSTKGQLAPIRARLMGRAERLLTAAPLLVSTTKRGEPDPPGQLKGLEAARRLQGRVLTFGMAFLLSGEKRYRNAALAELDHALGNWPIWVDTAHQPPFDLALVWKAQGGVDAAKGASRPLQIPPVKAFPSIGWAMLAPSQPAPPFFLAFKNGSLAAAHTHLDLNHVSIAVGDTMLVPDLGSRPYPADYFDRVKRNAYYEISTAGHNTVLIGGKGQTPERPGTLRGPIEGNRFTAFVGVADGAYDVNTPRARRHVVFVDKRYYVLLDEIEPAQPSSIELRFHTYGAVAPRAQGGWTVSQELVSVDLVPAVVCGGREAGLVGSVEAATGWTTPVKVLRLKSAVDATRFLIATAVLPSAGLADRTVAVSQAQDGDDLVVDVGNDRLVWRRGPDGYEFRAVTTRERRK